MSIANLLTGKTVFEGILERETGVEPATSTLARSRSTTELLPPCVFDYKQPLRMRQCSCHPERALFVKRGIWAGRAAKTARLASFLIKEAPLLAVW
jgi:hypothetical protein